MNKKYFSNIVYFTIACLAALFFTEKAFDFLVKKNYDLKSCYAYSGKIQSELLFQGNSRCIVMLDPDIIEKKTGYTCYNMGLTASDISYHLAMLKLYLKNNKPPKYLFLEVSPMFMDKLQITYFPSFQFIPFLNEKDIAEIIRERDFRTACLSYIPFGKYTLYNDKILNEVIKGAIHYIRNSSSEKNYVKGYSPNDIKWDGQWDSFKKSNPNGIPLSPDSLTLAKHIEYIKLTKEKGIKLICYEAPVLSESFHYFPNRDSVMHILDSIFNKYDVEYIKSVNLGGIGDHKSYFYNASHLNKAGAEKFTLLFGDYLIDNNILERKRKNHVK